MIFSIKNEKIYIGSTKYLPSRKAQHKHRLIKKTHHNRYLQNHVNKNGIDSLQFYILESNCVDLIEQEKKWIELLNPEFNLNFSFTTNNKKNRTKEQVQNIINGRIKNGSFRMSIKLSKEARAKIGLAHKGKKLSKKHRELISKNNKGRKVSEDVKKRISKKLKGREFSKDHRQKLSLKAKGNKNWKNINFKCPKRNKKISDGLKGKGILILDLNTGIYYTSIREASFSVCVNETTLSKILSGKYNKKRKNKNLIYA